jgi:RNA polymerase sigma factor (sigma-70 family)
MLNANYATNSLGESHQYWDSLSNLEVWQAFTKGDKNAFAFIYEKFSDELYSYGMKIKTNSNLIQDCMHDLFVDLWRQRANLKPTNNIKFYLFRALRRRITYAIERERKLYSETSEENVQDIIISLPFESEMINEQFLEDRKNKLLRALSKLSERQKEAIELIFFQKMSYEEVSEIMSINVRSVYTLTWKAISSMKKRLIEIMIVPLFFILL